MHRNSSSIWNTRKCSNEDEWRRRRRGQVSLFPSHSLSLSWMQLVRNRLEAATIIPLKIYSRMKWYSKTSHRFFPYNDCIHGTYDTFIRKEYWYLSHLKCFLWRNIRLVHIWSLRRGNPLWRFNKLKMKRQFYSIKKAKLLLISPSNDHLIRQRKRFYASWESLEFWIRIFSYFLFNVKTFGSNLRFTFEVNSTKAKN